MSLSHRVARMTGRDPHEEHRAATPLELLFDLTFVIAFSQASAQAAHYFELGHTGTAVLGFAIGVFAVTWAWINFSWLASAYDTDDVAFRIATFVEMLGVIVMALGLPRFFHSLDEGGHVDNGVLIAGYVVMRVATIALWLRAARSDPPRRRTCLTYAAGIAVVQVGWVVVLFTNPPVWIALSLMIALALAEMAVPLIAERRGRMTPWHAHHIAERYGLLVIITLGEVILGTVLAISAVVEEQGWSFEAVLVAFGGTLLAFTMWWTYFIVPTAELLERHRARSFWWGYLHIALFGSVAAVGAGLHVAAYVITGEAHVDDVYAILTVAVPVALFVVLVFAVYDVLSARFDPFHLWLGAGALLVAALGVLAVVAGASLGMGVLVIALAPAVVVIGFEAGGHRRAEAALAADRP